MCRYRPGILHKGWRRIDEYDLGEGGLPSDEIDYITCEACGKYPVRYVSVLEHNEYPNQLKVGCVCAEKLTEGYKNSPTKESNHADIETKIRQLIRQWTTPHFKVERFYLYVFLDKNKPGFWRWSRINKYTGHTKISCLYPTIETAKLAALRHAISVLYEYSIPV